MDIIRPAALLSVRQMMNTNFRALHPGEPLRTAVEYYYAYKLNTLPVVDESGNLLGVFPRRRFFKALLDGASLDEPFDRWMVREPIVVQANQSYDEESLVARVKRSEVDTVVVLDSDGKVVGLVGTAAYLRESLDVIAHSRNQQIDYYRRALINCDSTSAFDQIVTVNPAFMSIRDQAKRIARSRSTVLLTGESGVGKDMFARGIHAASPRAGEAFVKVNCVSVPESLFESELFGYAPGSFTGALKNGKPGYFERADKGTIFLDEIGDMPISIQSKLLQVLQDREFTRVGGSRTQRVDVRIIAATNRDLRDAIEKKTFREDLYYRLNVIEFHLPPLRERTEDIIPLAEHFAQKYNRVLGAKVTGISAGARRLLASYGWPGNIRELENAIEHAANYVWDGEIAASHLPSHIAITAKGAKIEKAAMGDAFSDANEFGKAANSFENTASALAAEAPGAAAPALSYRESKRDFERELIVDALERANGNRSEAARLLGVSRSAFYTKLSRYNIR